VIQNPFIHHACETYGTQKSSIETNIQETYAQYNEDLIVESILRSILTKSGRGMDSIKYIEIGANHPFQTSSTFLLYRLYGARGVLVEPIPSLAQILERQRPEDTVVNAVVTTKNDDYIDLNVHSKSEISSISIDHIDGFKDFGGRSGIAETIRCKNIHINDFMKTYSGENLDFLSIDCEGLDLDLVREMDSNFQPAIIQCEYEDRIDEFSSIFQKKDYRFVAMTNGNAIFVRGNII